MPARRHDRIPISSSSEPPTGRGNCLLGSRGPIGTALRSRSVPAVQFLSEGFFFPGSNVRVPPAAGSLYHTRLSQFLHYMASVLRWILKRIERLSRGAKADRQGLLHVVRRYLLDRLRNESISRHNLRWLQLLVSSPPLEYRWNRLRRLVWPLAEGLLPSVGYYRGVYRGPTQSSPLAVMIRLAAATPGASWQRTGGPRGKLVRVAGRRGEAQHTIGPLKEMRSYSKM